MEFPNAETVMATVTSSSLSGNDGANLFLAFSSESKGSFESNKLTNNKLITANNNTLIQNNPSLNGFHKIIM